MRLFFVLILFPALCFAQQNIVVDSITYSHPAGKSLLMDVYQPLGDKNTKHPLVILAHGGSFMHGNRKCDRQPALCMFLAQHGYVAVSIDYRLTSLPGMSTKCAAYSNILKAVADGRAAVSWFIKDAAQGNRFNVDTTAIFFGGSSAGAILAQQLGYIDELTNCNPTLTKAAQKYLPDSTAYIPHRVKGIISLAGALLDTNIITSGGPALLHIHGDADHIVPFGYKHALNGIAPFKLAGLQACRNIYPRLNIQYSEYVFKNAGHTTWDLDNMQFEIVKAKVLEFLSAHSTATLKQP
ncbi:MAG: carboxylesterase family protein [Chitinophagales bacterium]